MSTFWLVCTVFQDSFMVFHGFWLVSMVFQGSFMVFYGFWMNSVRLMIHFFSEKNKEIKNGNKIEAKLTKKVF